MRYFIMGESQNRDIGRKLIAIGLLLWGLSSVLWVFLSNINPGARSLLDLVSVGTIATGALIWDQKHMKKAVFMFGLAAVFKLFTLVWRFDGIFSFLTEIPFSFCVLFGVVVALDTVGVFYRAKGEPSVARWTERIERALPRAEVSFWIAVLISYVSDLLLFPMVLSFAWCLAVRVGAALLFMKKPQISLFRCFRSKMSSRTR